MPPHPGTSIEYCSANVFGSRKSSRLNASATTIADLPSGVEYMLYGSSTAIALPGLPVAGSIGIRLPSLRPSALFATHSVRRSHDGTTCCGLMPTLNLSTTVFVAWSITDTSHVDALPVVRAGATQFPGACLAVQVLRIDHGRHPGKDTQRAEHRDDR